MVLRMFRKKKRLYLVFCILGPILLIFGCEKDKSKESKENDDIENEMIKKPLRITNTGTIDIDSLTINYNYDANSCVIRDLKTGQMVRKQIFVSKETTLEFIIKYKNEQIITNDTGEWIMSVNKELQIVIEDNGKMYFR